MSQEGWMQLIFTLSAHALQVYGMATLYFE